MYELFLIPVLLTIPAAVAVAGAWLGHRRQRRRTANPVPRPRRDGGVLSQDEKV
jgi:hypothetical protein